MVTVYLPEKNDDLDLKVIICLTNIKSIKELLHCKRTVITGCFK